MTCRPCSVACSTSRAPLHRANSSPMQPRPALNSNALPSQLPVLTARQMGHSLRLLLCRSRRPLAILSYARLNRAHSLEVTWDKTGTARGYLFSLRRASSGSHPRLGRTSIFAGSGYFAASPLSYRRHFNLTPPRNCGSCHRERSSRRLSTYTSRRPSSLSSLFLTESFSRRP